MTMPRLVLLTPLAGRALERLEAPFAGHCSSIEIVATADALGALDLAEPTRLVSFGSGVVVPAGTLARLAGPAYNMHAAPPEFPGRDPHHHACYRGVTRYGATLHVMTARVDEGPIVAVERFPVAPDAAPADLLAAANEAGLRIVERLGPRLLATEPLPPLPDESWGAVKTRRADLLAMAEISPLITAAEFERLFRAFDGGGHDNLALSLHGRTFRIDKRTPLPMPPAHAFAEFTEAGFRRLLGQLKAGGYRFARYGEAGGPRDVLWRHDVDLSVHRAAALAAIEAENGVLATYFLNPRSAFYSLAEPEVAGRVRRIAALGHDIGLHFDAAARDETRWTIGTLAPALDQERALLEALIGVPVRAVSWHNPDMGNLLEFDADEIAGLVNAYSGRLRRDYAYCSDSNGYWRFKPMSDVIGEGRPLLHLLTHPGWWTPEAMSPSERVERAILGRARQVRSAYDDVLRRAGRRNVAARDGAGGVTGPLDGK